MTCSNACQVIITRENSLKCKLARFSLQLHACISLADCSVLLLTTDLKPLITSSDCSPPSPPAAPHLGHLYSAVLADAAGRYAALRHGRAAVLSTGTDEHGQKVRQAAAAAGCSPAQLSSRVSEQYRAVFDAAGVGYSRYIRTTQPEHRRAVHHFWVGVADGRRVNTVGCCLTSWTRGGS